MKRQTIESQWDENGYVLIPNLLETVQIEALRRVCDRVWEQWIQESPHPQATANSTNMAFLTETRYFKDDAEGLKILLNAIANPKILDILYQIFGKELLFHNTQYFVNPANDTRPGDWHRDQQFGAPDEETEKVRMRETIGVHVHIALLSDRNFEYVPGSHKRWDTPEEWAIRKGLNGQAKNSSQMPNAQRIDLSPGDAVFFDAWGIHRGNYIAHIDRRTFDIIYGTAANWCAPPPMCFLQPDILEGLPATTQAFFKRFIATHQERWLQGSDRP